LTGNDFQRIFEQGPGLCLLLAPDPSFTILGVSDAYLHATCRTRAELMGRPLFDMFAEPPDGPDFPRDGCIANLRVSLARVLATGAADTMAEQRYDLRQPVRDGGVPEEQWWSPVNTPVLSDTGALVCIVHRVEDATAPVRARAIEQEERAKLVEANNLFQAVYDQGLFAGRLDLHGRVTDANRSSMEHCGYVPADVIGKPFWECGWWNRQPSVQAWVKSGVLQALGGLPFRGESPYFWADGTERIVDFACMPIKDAQGEVLFVVPTGMDITERVRQRRDQRHAAERERLVAESEHQRRVYETALSNTPDLVYIFDRDHRFVYANAALLRMWGKTPEEAVGRTCIELGYEPWHAEMHNREIDQVVATRAPIRGEVPFTGTTGRRVYDYIFVPVMGPDGEVIAVAGTTRDVTERQHAEQSIRDQAERLRESDRAKDEFLATLAHELRNPLAPLRNSLSLLELAGPPDARTAPIHQMMERQVNHLVRLVDDLLEMSRVSRGTFALRKEPVDVATVVRNAVETSEPLIRASGHRLELALPEPPLWLEGDPVRLAQILANLLNNAAKYTDDGGQISVHARRDAGSAVIAVRDNGVGIAADALPRMFAMFTRGARASARSQGGLGIGLALARRLAEMHGGTVDAWSAGPGQGSEFTLRLPLADAPAQPADAPAEDAPTLTPQRILVVDDNRDAADSLGMILQFLGADVRIAEDGPQALAVFADYDPAVVLLDIGMPGMDGYEVARTLRTRYPDRSTAIVALTGWGLADDRRRAQDARLETVLQASYPGLVMDESSPAVRTALEITGANRAEAVSYGTEAGYFQQAGIPAVICGPGSIDQAHKADEFVALSELVACEAFLGKVIAKACT